MRPDQDPGKNGTGLRSEIQGIFDSLGISRILEFSRIRIRKIRDYTPKPASETKSGAKILNFRQDIIFYVSERIIHESSYLDLLWLYNLGSRRAFFVIWLKNIILYWIMKSFNIKF